MPWEPRPSIVPRTLGRTSGAKATTNSVVPIRTATAGRVNLGRKDSTVGPRYRMTARRRCTWRGGGIWFGDVSRSCDTIPPLGGHAIWVCLCVVRLDMLHPRDE